MDTIPYSIENAIVQICPQKSPLAIKTSPVTPIRVASIIRILFSPPTRKVMISAAREDIQSILSNLLNFLNGFFSFLFYFLVDDVSVRGQRGGGE